MTILDQLAESARERTLLAKKELPMAVSEKMSFPFPKERFPLNRLLENLECPLSANAKKHLLQKG